MTNSFNSRSSKERQGIFSDYARIKHQNKKKFIRFLQYGVLTNLQKHVSLGVLKIKNKDNNQYNCLHVGTIYIITHTKREKEGDHFLDHLKKHVAPALPLMFIIKTHILFAIIVSAIYFGTKNNFTCNILLFFFQN